MTKPLSLQTIRRTATVAMLLAPAIANAQVVGGSSLTGSLMNAVDWVISSFGAPLATAAAIIIAFLLFSGRVMWSMIAFAVVGVIIFLHASDIGSTLQSF